MVPIDSPGMVSYSTSIDTIVVSVTVIEIFSIKAVKLSCVAHFQNGARKVGGAQLCRCGVTLFNPLSDRKSAYCRLCYTVT